jgi:structural maintenance of chromosome 4
VKQKELQPWTTKINAKQAGIDVARSERDALDMKADTIRKTVKTAVEEFEKLKGDQETKVGFRRSPSPNTALRW